MDFFHDAGAGGRDGGHGFFVFQLHDGLILGDGVALLHENADHDAGIGAFTELGEFDIHN